MKNQLLIRRRKSEPLPFDLLLLADPSKKMIDRYLSKSEVFIATTHDQTIGVLVLRIEGKEAEIMNLAVAEAHQGKGIGSRLINHAISISKEKGLRKLMIATADTSKNQLRLYQHLGFTVSEQVKDFFIKNYEMPIMENGKQAKDMIRLGMMLT